MTKILDDKGVEIYNGPVSVIVEPEKTKIVLSPEQYKRIKVPGFEERELRDSQAEITMRWGLLPQTVENSSRYLSGSKEIELAIRNESYVARDFVTSVQRSLKYLIDKLFNPLGDSFRTTEMTPATVSGPQLVKPDFNPHASKYEANLRSISKRDGIDYRV